VTILFCVNCSGNNKGSEKSIQPEIESYEEKRHSSTEKKEIPWSIEYLKIQQIHDSYKVFGEGVSIAILDTGIKSNHKDLKIRGGINIINHSTNYEDDNGHGTHIAGIIARIAPKAELYSVKVLNKKQIGSYENIAKGIEWAINNDIDIILMSFGGSKDSRILKEAIKKADSENITLIASTGNTALSNNSITYPAKYEEVIAVGAITENNERWVGSNTGKELTVMAPGHKILSTSIDGNYTIRSGTSLAAAHVAGGLALLLSYNPLLDNKDLREIIIQSSIKKTPDGYRIFNLEEAFKICKNFKK
jgi:subtilisin